MAKNVGKTFTKVTVKLDSNEFQSCRFIGCDMQYGGGLPPRLQDCDFQDCTWSFGGGAANTLGFLSGFYNGGFADIVENTFHLVRKGHFNEIPQDDSNEPEAKPKADRSNQHSLLNRIPRLLKIPLNRDKNK